MSDIEIPDAALDAATAAIGRSVWKPHDLAWSVLYAAGPALVAAELRRLADEVADQVKAMTGFPTLEAETDALTGVMRTLRARADELDPPQETAEQLRARARDLYRRSDNVPGEDPDPGGVPRGARAERGVVRREQPVDAARAERRRDPAGHPAAPAGVTAQARKRIRA